MYEQVHICENVNIHDFTSELSDNLYFVKMYSIVKHSIVKQVQNAFIDEITSSSFDHNQIGATQDRIKCTYNSVHRIKARTFMIKQSRSLFGTQNYVQYN